MGMKETVRSMKDLLIEMNEDLERAEKGNKTAAQRVRTGSIRFSKLAKLYRKESIKSEKKRV